MKSQDWANMENYRNKLLAELMEWCVDHGLNSNATEKRIIIQLPTVQEMSVWPEHKKRKVFNWDSLPSNGIIEGDGQHYTELKPPTGNVLNGEGSLPDELEPPNYTLDEGEPPVDKDKED